MADDLTVGSAEHSSEPKQLKQSGQKKVSTHRTKRSGPGKEIKDEQRLKELEASIRSQVAAEEKAHKIVEKLVLEDEISEDFFIHSGNFITTSHYADVVEERMIAKKCGYPLCNNQLSQIPSQKYKISLRTNRVYDITERKCFCSNFCFKASKYFESQILDSPVWTRIGESLKSFTLLEREGSSSSGAGGGKVLIGGDAKTQQQNVRDEGEDDCVTNYGQGDTKKHPNNTVDGQVAGNEIHGTTEANQGSTEKDSEILIPGKPTCDSKDSVVTKALSSLSLSSLKNVKPESDHGRKQFISKKEGREDISKESCSRDTIVQSVQVVFQEWCTHSTLEYLGLPVKTDTNSSFPEDEEKDPDSFMARAARFFQTGNNAKEDSDSDSETEASSKIAQENIVVKEKKGVDQNLVCIVPPIDSKSQRTIRRRIVLDKLFRTLPDLLSEVKLTVGEISRDLTELVHTFCLSSTNVALKPLQWKILALALVVILQRKNSLVSQAMKSCSNEFDALLGRLAISRQDIDRVLSPLSSFEPQHLGRHKTLEAVNTCKASEEKIEIVLEERNDYGDMEELD